MSSPIHRFLFSPPPSPPIRPSDKDHVVAIARPPLLSSLQGTLPDSASLMPRSSPDVVELRPRSPHTTPQQKHFTLDNTYSAPYPSREQDLEATPRAVEIVTPRRKVEKIIAAPLSVPSGPLPMPSTLPRPLVRLLFLASLVVGSILMLTFVPSARLPSLHDASVSRRLALAPDGRAYFDVANTVESWEEAREREYQPPQVRTKIMKKLPTPMAALAAYPPPRASRPMLAPRPLPSTHELLAIQSYLLQSVYNVLPETVDPHNPLDANLVLAFSGASGSEEEKKWLGEIEKEREGEVVIWYGGDGSARQPQELLSLLSGFHGPSHHPTLIPCHARPDLPLLNTIFDRLNLPFSRHPLVMIGNEPIVGDPETLEEGRLAEMLKRIGWNRDPAEGKRGWKPKFAKVKRRERSELEEALIAN